jgi:hypothetical protein
MHQPPIWPLPSVRQRPRTSPFPLSGSPPFPLSRLRNACCIRPVPPADPPRPQVPLAVDRPRGLYASPSSGCFRALAEAQDEGKRVGSRRETPAPTRSFCLSMPSPLERARLTPHRHGAAAAVGSQDQGRQPLAGKTDT